MIAAHGLFHWDLAIWACSCRAFDPGIRRLLVLIFLHQLDNDTLPKLTLQRCAFRGTLWKVEVLHYKCVRDRLRTFRDGTVPIHALGYRLEFTGSFQHTMYAYRRSKS